ncbi:strabismus domain-containing protein Vang [Brevipalpus obovatus]|uniref:strabismus domain-containing protein Vang n=1 Tax=Brevipalpus obovatus TaxID=246614 RepID=UPI003D9EAD79
MDTESVRSGYSERVRRTGNRIPHGVIHSESCNIIQSNLSSPYNDLGNGDRLNYINQSSSNHHHAIGNHVVRQNRSLGRAHGYRSNHHHRKLSSSSSVVNDVRGHVRLTGNNSSVNFTDYGRRSDDVVVQIMSQQQQQPHHHQQDDRWADNTTAITGNTSEHSMSVDMDLNKIGKSGMNPWTNHTFRYRCELWCAPIYAGLISFCAFISPILMLSLPKVDSFEWKVKECGPECDGLLISFTFKMIVLLICSWAVFFRLPRSSLPQIHIYRAIVMAMLVLLIITYWLFYGERIFDKRFADYELTYESVVQFTVPFVDLLLWIHYVAVILIHIKHRTTPVYQVKVLRSPDGESHTYNIGELDIQRTAVWILDKYYKDFSIYNPYLDLLPIRSSGGNSSRGTKSHHHNHISAHSDLHHHDSIGDGNHVISNLSTIKYYDIDGVNNPPSTTPTTVPGIGNGGPGLINSNNSTSITGSLPPPLPPSLLIANNTNDNHSTINNNDNNNLDDRSSRRGGGGRSNSASHNHHHHHHHHHHSERFYEEHEYERRVRKRKSRILSASEEAFTHIKRIRPDESCPLSTPIDPREAAQAIFPAIARSLQKFLRITRQQPRHTVESIIDHLSVCLTYDLSPKAFLEKYFNTRPVLQNDLELKLPIQSWGLVSDIPLTRNIEPGSVFMLRQGDISLLVTINSLPHFQITEEIIDPKCNRFVLKMNSETSV